MMHVRDGNGGLIFLNASGGTGKTLLLNLVLAEIRINYEIARVVASLGIAVIILNG